MKISQKLSNDFDIHRREFKSVFCNWQSVLELEHPVWDFSRFSFAVRFAT